MEYPVLGVRVLIKSDIPKIRHMADLRFGHWRKLPEHSVSPGFPVIVSICQSDISTSIKKKESIQYKVEPDFLSAEAAGVIFEADRKAGKAKAYVNPMTADLSDFFQKNILESMVLFLATATDREPLHASAVIRNKTALLICGSSGSGKTTLAYSLYKRGAYVLAESAIYISREKGWQLWGDPLGFNFKRDACEQFPELLNIPEDLLPNGRLKIPLKLPLEGESDRRKWVFSGNIIIVFPERTDESHSRICEISHAEMLKRVTSNRESGFDLSDTFENTMSELPVRSSYIVETGTDIMQTTNILESLFL